MRTIKFRLIRDNKIVGYEEHRYIENLLEKKGSSIYIYHSHTGHGLSWKCVSMGEKNYIKHDDKDQYTGFRCGSSPFREIYTEDIIRFIAFSPKHDAEIIGIVQWDNKYGCLHIKDVSEKNLYYSFGFPSMHDMGVKILGNIYENPELLNENSKTD